MGQLDTNQHLNNAEESGRGEESKVACERVKAVHRHTFARSVGPDGSPFDVIFGNAFEMLILGGGTSAATKDEGKAKWISPAGVSGEDGDSGSEFWTRVGVFGELGCSTETETETAVGSGRVRAARRREGERG